MELSPEQQEKYNKISQEIDHYMKAMNDPHIASNTRTEYSNRIHHLLSQRQQIIVSTLPKDSRTSEQKEIDMLFKKIEGLEQAVYSQIEREEVVRRALGQTDRAPRENYEMRAKFGEITRALSRIDKIQNGEIDLAKEREEHLAKQEADRAEQERRYVKNVDDEKARKHAFAKTNWRHKSTFNQTYGKATPKDPFAKFYLTKLTYDAGQTVKKKANELGIKLGWDPYIQRWYSPESLTGKPEANDIRELFLPVEKNQVAKEWSTKIKDELENKTPEERELTKKVHKTPEPEFWKKLQKARGE